MSRAPFATIEGVEFEYDTAARALASQDLFTRSAQPVAAIARPRDRAALARLVGEAARASIPLVPRGGGMSYTRGYLAGSGDAVSVDLAGLDAIERIDTENLVAVVEPGCTWEKLRTALASQGLRTRFGGPLSGLRATIGGGVSQNAAFWGSGRHGTAAESVLGLEVVTGTGESICTGALASRDSMPFFRYDGPDATGLFIGDGGAFGIKARIALDLRREPAASDALSFSFDAAAPLLAAMSEIARADLVAQQVAFDPLLVALRTRRQSLAEDFRALSGLLRGPRSLARGLKDASAAIAGGRGFLDGAGYLLHAMAEARGFASLREDLEAIRSIALRHGAREVANTVAKVVLATPFPALNGIIGPDGERWVPVHGVLPVARAEAGYRALLDTLDARVEALAAHGISCGTLFSTLGPQAVLMEPMFFWPDALDALHDATLEPRVIARIPRRAAQPAARALVAELRRAVIDALQPLGAAHLQLGRTYPWLERRDATFAATMHSIKRTLDPAGILNPGVIGLGGPR